eukprot:729635-Hanusia_phi.AAC.1
MSHVAARPHCPAVPGTAASSTRAFKAQVYYGTTSRLLGSDHRHRGPGPAARARAASPPLRVRRSKRVESQSSILV